MGRHHYSDRQGRGHGRRGRPGPVPTTMSKATTGTTAWAVHNLKSRQTDPETTGPAAVPESESQLGERFFERVRMFAWHRLRERSAAEDVAQETFIKAYRSIGGFRGDASLGTWLIAIARKTAAQWYRRRKVEHDPDQVKEPAVGNTDAALDHLEIRSAVAGLPEHYREVVVLRYTNQLDLNEISSVTGVSRSAVGVRLHRARQLLRDALGAARKQEVCRDEL